MRHFYAPALRRSRLTGARATHELTGAGKLIAKAQVVISPPTGAGVAGGITADGGIEYELARERARIDHALTIAAGVRMIAQSDRANLVAGESFTVRVEALHRDNISGADFATPTVVLPAGWQAAAPTKDQNDAWAIQVTLPKDATAPHGAADWMFPFRSAASPSARARHHRRLRI